MPEEFASEEAVNKATDPDAASPPASKFLKTDGSEAPPPIDDLERKILSLLSENARVSARAVARELGVSPTLVLDRIARLERSGIILGYRVEVNPAAAGVGVSATVGIRLNDGGNVSDAMDYLSSIDEVQVVLAVTGSYDLLVSISARSNADLSGIVIDKIRRMPGFNGSETMIALVQMRRVGGRFSYVWTNS